MKIYNTLDEKQRLVRLPKYCINEPSGQLNSHTCSYLFARKELSKAQPLPLMGLDKLVNSYYEMMSAQEQVNIELSRDFVSEDVQVEYLRCLNNFNFCKNYLEHNGLEYKDVVGELSSRAKRGDE